MPKWTPWPAFEIRKGAHRSPWVIVREDLGTATRLKLTADGEWSIAKGLLVSCGPDGYAGLPLKDAALLIASAPPGALIAKFCGSPAGVGPPPAADKPAADAPFLVGRRCEVAVAAGAGPLMIGFNTALGRPVEITSEFRLAIQAVLA